MDRKRNRARVAGLAALTATEFNQRFVVGQPVVYTPVRGREATIPPLVTTTRSEAWELGGGTVVVAIKGRAGGVSLAHLDVAPAEAPHWECSQHGRSPERCCDRAALPEAP